MNDTQWYHEEASHLVRAHGAGAERLSGLGLPLNKLLWVHFDTHTALQVAGLQPPAGHVHRELLDPNQVTDSRFAPLRRAPSSITHSANYDAHFYASDSYTSLPQTGLCPSPDAGDVTGRWASMVVEALGAHFAAGCPETDYAVVNSPAVRAVREHFTSGGEHNVTAGQAVAAYRDWIERQAGGVSPRSLIRDGFPAAVARTGSRRSSVIRARQRRIPPQARGR